MIASVAGAELELLPERAAYWAETSTLLVADLHLGKAATFRAMGAPVPETPTFETLDCLSRLVDRIMPKKLTILGDLFHAREAMFGAPRDALMAWIEKHRELQIELIVGNHDRRALLAADESLRSALPMVDCGQDGPFCFAHHPPKGAMPGYVLCGHIHPGFRLTARGRRSLKLPCFWFTEEFAVLPAFGEFTGLAMVEPSEGDRVYLCSGREVIQVPL